MAALRILNEYKYACFTLIQSKWQLPWILQRNNQPTNENIQRLHFIKDESQSI